MSQRDRMTSDLIARKKEAIALPDPTEARPMAPAVNPPLASSQPPSQAPVLPPQSGGTKSMTMRLRPEVHRHLKVLAFQKGISMASMIEIAIDEWLERNPE